MKTATHNSSIRRVSNLVLARTRSQHRCTHRIGKTHRKASVRAPAPSTYPHLDLLLEPLHRAQPARALLQLLAVAFLCLHRAQKKVRVWCVRGGRAANRDADALKRPLRALSPRVAARQPLVTRDWMCEACCRLCSALSPPPAPDTSPPFLARQALKRARQVRQAQALYRQ